MLLAELTPTPVQLAAWLACAAFLIGLINGALKLVDRIKDKPAPGDVRAEAADKFVLKTDCALRGQEFKEHVKWDSDEHDKLFRKIGGVERGQVDRLDQRFAEIQRANEENREKLHKRINRVSIGVARLCGKLGVHMPGEEEEI